MVRTTATLVSIYLSISLSHTHTHTSIILRVIGQGGLGGEVVMVVEENGVQLCVEIHLFRDKAPPKSLLYHYSIESMERGPFWTPRTRPVVVVV